MNKKYLFAILALVSLSGYLIYVKYIGALPDTIVNFFSEMEAPSADEKILVFAPHQDDEVLGSGALMIMAKREGAAVKIVIATNGNKNGIKSIRYGEALAAASILGIGKNDVVFWDYPDSKLKNYEKPLASQIKALVEDFQPTIIVTPDPEDIHRDHKALGEAVDACLQSIGYEGRILGYLVHYKNFPRPLGYAPNKNLLPPIKLLTQTKKWVRLSISPEVEEMKREAVLRYQSQLQIPWLKSLLLSFIRQNELFSNL